jgi:hypothetical protein
VAATGKAEDAISNATPLQVSEVAPEEDEMPVDDRAPAEIVEEENTEDLYSVKNFGV